MTTTNESAIVAVLKQINEENPGLLENFINEANKTDPSNSKALWALITKFPIIFSRNFIRVLAAYVGIKY